MTDTLIQIMHILETHINAPKTDMHYAAVKIEELLKPSEAPLAEIIGTLEPIAEQDWHGKWRIQKAIKLLKDARVQMGGEASEISVEIAALKRFKDYVHKRLDDAGIATHPEGEHSKHGCRIGDRLDIALKRESVTPSIDRIKTFLTVIRCDLERRFQTSDYCPDRFEDTPRPGRIIASEICQEIMQHNRAIHANVVKLITEIESGKI